LIEGEGKNTSWGESSRDPREKHCVLLVSVSFPFSFLFLIAFFHSPFFFKDTQELETEGATYGFTP
jgi:hypothetical protein